MRLSIREFHLIDMKKMFKDNNKNSGEVYKGRSLWADGLTRLRRRKLAMIFLAVIVFYILVALYVQVAEWQGQIWPAQWNEIVGQKYQSPSLEHICGTDIFGQSVFRKVVYGAKISLTVAFFASIISIVIGVPLGAMAGYFGGVIDEIVVWIYSTLSSIPHILLILAFAMVLKDKTVAGFEIAGNTTVYLAIGLTSWVGICRLIRGEVIKHKDRDYVLAAKSYGCGTRRIIFRHIIPNIFHLVIISFSLRFVNFIHAEVILSFLGLGEKNKPSWGAMIDSARLDLSRGYWWEMTAATVAILVISLALNVFGDALRDCLDPKLKVGK